MKALTLIPHLQHSASLAEVPEPIPDQNQLLVELIALGICGTDKEMIHGEYGWSPASKSELIIGHESLGRVIAAPTHSEFKVGDFVAGIVRRPDPVPCSSCAVGEWDMCKNGRYTERGIKELDGFGVERFQLEPEFAVPVDSKLGVVGVLTEPTSIVAKAWQQIEKIGARTSFSPRRVLITGAGTIGLLALMIARQRGYEVHVLDQVTSGPKPLLVKDMGACYYTDISDLQPMRNTFDIVIECTGDTHLVVEVMTIAGPNSVVCLTGVSSGNRKIEVDFGRISRCMVLENGVVFGSVNANRLHYQLATQALGLADYSWLSRLITRRIPFSRWEEVLTPGENDVKTILVPDKYLAY